MELKILKKNEIIKCNILQKEYKILSTIITKLQNVIMMNENILIFSKNSCMKNLNEMIKKLNELYKWEFKIESLYELNIFSNVELDSLDILNIFDREIKLKKLISNKNGN